MKYCTTCARREHNYVTVCSADGCGGRSFAPTFSDLPEDVAFTPKDRRFLRALHMTVDEPVPKPNAP